MKTQDLRPFDDTGKYVLPMEYSSSSTESQVSIPSNRMHERTSICLQAPKKWQIFGRAAHGTQL